MLHIPKNFNWIKKKNDWSAFFYFFLILIYIPKILCIGSYKANIYKYNLLLTQNCLCWHFLFFLLLFLWVLYTNQSLIRMSTNTIYRRYVYSECYFSSLLVLISVTRACYDDILLAIYSIYMVHWRGKIVFICFEY